MFIHSNLKIYDALVTNKYTVDIEHVNVYEGKNDMADTTTLQVKVQNSSTDTTTTTYTLSTDLANIPVTTVYCEGEDEQYEVKFGDGILGKALSTGNIVSLVYSYKWCR